MMTTTRSRGDLQELAADAPRHVTLSDVQQRRRVVIVGDIHGCCAEFRELLDAHVRPGDTLILAGDLVNKGPNSAEVVRVARERNALAVVGNHELASLRARARRSGGANPDAETFYAWTDELSEEDVAYIKALPFTISLPLHDALVVHAGLVKSLLMKLGGGGLPPNARARRLICLCHGRCRGCRSRNKTPSAWSQ